MVRAFNQNNVSVIVLSSVSCVVSCVVFFIVLGAVCDMFGCVLWCAAHSSCVHECACFSCVLACVREFACVHGFLPCRRGVLV